MSPFYCYVENYRIAEKLSAKFKTLKGKSPSKTVAIIGGGPGGATLANILASRDVSTVLIERQKDFSKEFRGEGLIKNIRM